MVSGFHLIHADIELLYGSFQQFMSLRSANLESTGWQKSASITFLTCSYNIHESAVFGYYGNSKGSTAAIA